MFRCRTFLLFCGFLLIAEAIFLIHSSRRKRFLLRFSLSFAAFILIAYGVHELFNLIPRTSSTFSIVIIGYFFSLFLLTIIPIAVSFDLKWKQILFIVCGGYSVEHIGSALRSIIQYSFSLNTGGFWDEFILALPRAIVPIIIYFVLIRPSVRHGEMLNASKGVLILSFINLMTCIVLSVFAYGGPSNRYLTDVICKIYAILSCTVMLCMQFGLFRQNKLLRDRRLTEQLLHLDRKQHEISKETIELINIKCHDLKHQIVRLEALKNTEEQKESIEEIAKAVLIYDSITKTGNDSLDIVLMEKKLLCDKYGVKFSYIIDGEKLGFMRSADVYSLFSNMFDNALESVCDESDSEKRIASLRVWCKDQMLFIHMSNYCCRDVVFEDDLPVTTKADKDFHGFGARSIRYIVSRYNGELRMSLQDNQFNVNIMFQLPG